MFIASQTLAAILAYDLSSANILWTAIENADLVIAYYESYNKKITYNESLIGNIENKVISAPPATCVEEKDTTTDR